MGAAVDGQVGRAGDESEGDAKSLATVRFSISQPKVFHVPVEHCRSDWTACEPRSCSGSSGCRCNIAKYKSVIGGGAATPHPAACLNFPPQARGFGQVARNQDLASRYNRPIK